MRTIPFYVAGDFVPGAGFKPSLALSGLSLTTETDNSCPPSSPDPTKTVAPTKVGCLAVHHVTHTAQLKQAVSHMAYSV